MALESCFLELAGRTFLQSTQKVEGRVWLKCLEVLHPSPTCFMTLDKSFYLVGLNFHGSNLRGEEHYLSQGCNHVPVKRFVHPREV